MGIKYLGSTIIILLALWIVSCIFIQAYARWENATNTSLSNFTVTIVIHKKTVSSIPALVSAPGLKRH